jgi:CRISPR/Cas system CSM-associated protein Csm2 small subunit
VFLYSFQKTQENLVSLQNNTEEKMNLTEKRVLLAVYYAGRDAVSKTTLKTAMAEYIDSMSDEDIEHQYNDKSHHVPAYQEFLQAGISKLS